MRSKGLELDMMEGMVPRIPVAEVTGTSEVVEKIRQMDEQRLALLRCSNKLLPCILLSQPTNQLARFFQLSPPPSVTVDSAPSFTARGFFFAQLMMTSPLD